MISHKYGVQNMVLILINSSGGLFQKPNVNAYYSFMPFTFFFVRNPFFINQRSRKGRQRSFKRLSPTNNITKFPAVACIVKIDGLVIGGHSELYVIANEVGQQWYKVRFFDI